MLLDRILGLAFHCVEVAFSKYSHKVNEWRERVGIEPTPDGISRQTKGLKPSTPFSVNLVVEMVKRKRNPLP